MPVRDRFPTDYFDKNPLAGENALGAYRRLQWGNKPRYTWRIEAPEPMAVLGRLAKLVFAGKGQQNYPDWSMFVSVGTRTNRVYLVPMKGRKPVPFPLRFNQRCEAIVKLRRIDYYSEKGNEEGYYYHDHEPPFPTLRGLNDHFVIMPAKHRGGRSYAVNDEGIIG
jgi:hypothetical protein